MRLKSIEIQGFKSFADKTVLQFGEGITAVVGPNGSGKSNISDAVRWVLGEQSNKTLRSNRMEDVIFGGTATRKRLGFAEVTLVIDNKERNLPMDEDEVAVTRRYYRSGESEYRLNNISVRLKDIHELFMDTGLGRDGYSMVGQGKIDDIVGTKTSSERRDIFEEAAGISRFRYRKLEAERKLAQAEDNMTRLRDILQELESRVGPLAEQSKKAMVFLEYSKEQETLQIGLWLNTLSKYKEALAEQEYKITAARDQYEEINSKIAVLDSRIDASADESMRISAATEDARTKSAELEEAAARVDADVAVKSNTIFHNNETVQRIESDISDVENGGSSISADIALKTADIAARATEIEQIRLLLEQANERLLGLISDSDGFSSQIEQFNAVLNSISVKSSDERVALIAAKTAIDEIVARREVITSLLGEKTASLDSLKNEHDLLLKDLDAAEETVAECTNSLNGRKLILSSRAEEGEKLKAELDKLTLDEGEKRRRAQILKDLERNMEGFGFAIKSVVQASESGKLGGVHGPVSRIMKVESKYSAAIECALGAALQNIVVDNETDAKRAIQYLKNNKLGRATFLPMTAIKPRMFKESGLDNCTGFVSLAVDLISYEKKYSNILSNLLGGIAVAEDIDCAVAIAKKYGYRFKVVTLDGQIVNAGGSLTGGSLSKNAGILSRSGDIDKLLSQADEIAKKIADVSERHKARQAEIASLEAEMLVAQSAITTAQEDKIRVLGEIKRVDEQISLTEADCKSLSDESAANEQRLTELNSEKERAEASLEQLSTQSAENQLKLDALVGGRDASSSVRKELEEEISGYKTGIFEKERDIDVLRSSISELNSFVSGQDERVAKMRADIQAINAQNEIIEAEITGLKAQAEAYRQQAEQTKSSVSTLLTARDELDKSVQNMRVEERTLASDREKMNGELVRLEERKISMVHEYDDTIKKLYDEYGLTRSEAEEKGSIPEDIPAAQRRLVELRSKIRGLGSVNVSAIEEYKEVSERYEFMSAQITDIEQSRAQLIKLISELTKQMETTFIERFNAINTYFGQVFVKLFGGGTAELRLTDSENILESGIEILAQPPGKNISIIEQLSGGEKALIAISIYFAVMKVNPPPFCILDEVDAALDDVNVTRFAEYLRKMSGQSQFILITHRRGSMEEADMLYGVTMQEKGISKLLELNVSELESRLKMKAE